MTSTASPLEKQRLLGSASEQSQLWARKTFAAYLDELDEKLFSMADKAGNNADQQRYFQTREELKNLQHSLQEQFSASIDNAFRLYEKGQPTCKEYNSPAEDEQTSGHQLTEDDFSLVDKQDLEESLAISGMSQRARGDNGEQLYALNQRFAALHAESSFTELHNPLAPAVFCEALRAAAASMDLDETSRLLVYKVFDKSFIAQLGQLYEKINNLFKANGLLPNLNFFVRKSPEEILAGLPEELKGQMSDVSANKQLELIKAIQVIQHQLSARAPSARPRVGPALSVQGLLDGIKQLQYVAAQQLAGGGLSHSSTNTSAAAPLRQQAEEQTQQTEEIDQNVIEIVGLLFEYMLNDEQLPDSVKALLSYLHTPFLKIALQEKDFFNHPEHPARQLLNSLVAAGERWVEPTGKRRNEVFEQIRSIVQRVLQEFDNDIRLFSELAFEFNGYLRQHARRIRLLEQRARQAAEGENKLKEIRLKIETFIQKKTEGVHLPMDVKNLLYEPWANFLSFNVLRYGPESDQWREAATVIEDIVWYCQPHDTEKDAFARARLSDLRQSLPKDLQAGLDTVGYDNSRGQRLIKGLLERDGHTLSDATATDTSSAMPANSMAAQIPQDHQHLLEDMVPDTWFEYINDEQKSLHVKLAWASETTSQYMFVNRLGQQIAVKSGQELINAMRAGNFRKLPTMGGRPFFEKAMEVALKELEKRAQTGD